MTCEGCSNPTGCLYIDGCRTCSLRAIIASQPFWQSMRKGLRRVDRACAQDRIADREGVMRLTAKQEAFCRGIVEGKTQYDAYIAAYGQREGRPRNGIDRDASLLRDKAKIAQRIAELARAVEEQFEVRVSDLLRESACVAYSDVSKIIDPATGRVKLPHELDEDTRRAVSAFEIDDLGRIKYKFWDKNTAQDRLFKFKGLYEKDHSQATAGLTALRDALVGAVVGPDPAAAQPDDDEDLDERA